MALAIITGASSGMGAQFARELSARYGICDFWFIARRGEKMTALAEELGVNAKIITADLGTKEGIDKVKAELLLEKPAVSYLINAAGFGVFGGFDEIEEQTVEGMIDLNVKALVLITHAVIPYMERGGRIIQLGSGSCFTPLPYFNVYAASKSFVLHYTKALSFEIKKYGVSATCFCPGWVGTEFLPLAKRDTGVTMPKKIFPVLNCEKVVTGALKAAAKRKRMYVTGKFTKFQHFLFKAIPDRILSCLWIFMLRKPKGDTKNEEKL
jgi:short-subunit dehydrogenase